MTETSETPRHNRRSIRLKGYDYSQPGGYAITICVQNKECLFGYVKDAKMHMNEAGLMVQKWWLRLEENNDNVTLDEYMVMPNHFHGIIFILNSVGADQRVRPIVGADQRVRPIEQEGKHVGLPLPRFIQWFKTMTTNEYIRGAKEGRWPAFFKRFWQRNYYEHIIRDEEDLNRIRAYIIENPLKWELDEYYQSKNGSMPPSID